MSDPGAVDRLFAHAVSLVGQAAFSEAVTALSEVLSLSPELVRARVLRALCLVRLGRLAEAEGDLEKSEASASTDPEWFSAAIQLRRNAGAFEQALEVARAGLRSFPDEPALRFYFVESLLGVGRYEEASDFLEASLRRGPVAPAMLVLWGVACRRLAVPERSLPALLDGVAADGVAPAQVRNLRFALGMVFDALGEYDRAFAEFELANRIDRARFDLVGYRDAVRQVGSHWTRQRLAKLPTAEVDCGDLLFVVGMPRSGSTLIEQILQAHSRVLGNGEVEWLFDAARTLRLDPVGMENWRLVRDPGQITGSTVDRINHAYRAHLPEQSVAAGSRFIDKNLGIHRMLGLVQVALPGARVLWCRRHPLDTVLSCFFQNFRNNAGYDRLDVIAQRLHLADQLASHWGEVLDQPILPVQYEELVAEPDPQIKGLIAAVGLDWEEACLRPDQSERVAQTASRHQVNRPIYQGSVGRWRNYEKHLAHPISILERLGYEL